MKIAIITSIAGLTNKLATPQQIFPNVDYHAFVDNPIPDSIWTQHINLPFTIDTQYEGRRKAKVAKIIPHLFLPNYDYYFWIDSTHEVVKDPLEILKEINYTDIALFNHSQRSCAYDEIKILKELNLDHNENLTNFENFLTQHNYPHNKGLYELPCSIRKNTPIINTLNLMWWEIICKYSSRDQISLPYIIDKLNIDPYILEGCANCGFDGNNYMPQKRHKNY
tara:strand:- start:6282 stop:6950 length:669 start_codon:yes stop_codon:yes gene_type:complete